MMKKQCRICGEMKDLDAFGTNKECAGGRDTLCKECKNARERNRYRTRDPSRVVVPDKKICTKCKETKDIDQFLVSRNNSTGRSSHCKSCHKEYYDQKRLDGKLAGGRPGWNRIKQSARRRGLIFDISKEDFFEWWETLPHQCHYCHIDVDGFLKVRDAILSGAIQELSRFRQIFANPSHAKILELSVERLNPDGGYTMDNIAKACWVCNFIKGSILSESQMLKIAPQIRQDIDAIVAKHEMNKGRIRKHGKAF